MIARVFDIGVARARRELALYHGNAALKMPMRTGQVAATMVGGGTLACPPPNYQNFNCPPLGCDPPGVAAQRVPGYQGPCKEMMTGLDATVAAGATATITADPLVTMCPHHLLIVTTGTAGFRLSNLRINNSPQWEIDDNFHSDMFAPGSDNNTLLRGDCFAPGSTISVVAENLDGANARRIFLAFKGIAIN